MTATTTPTRTTTRGNSAVKAPKAVRKETTKALTAAQQAKLDALVTVARKGIADAESGSKELDAVMASIGNAKVYAARALALLSTHPAMIATRGIKAGEPALTKMATLIGRPAQSLETYWKGAKALISKGWEKRTSVPKPEEIALVMAGFKSESARVMASTAKGKGKGTAPKGTRSTTITVDTINGQLDAVLESVQKFAASFGFTDEQAKSIFAKLDAVTDVVETATAKAATK